MSRTAFTSSRLQWLAIALFVQACWTESSSDLGSEGPGLRAEALSEAFVAYHGITAADHQTRLNELSAAGYRPVSLNVSGDPADARYAAVWVQRPGAAWWALHGYNAADYQTQFDQLTAQGYAPVSVSATGSAGSEIYAAIFEQNAPGRWYARHGLHWGDANDPDSIVHENQIAFERGYIPRSLAVSGDASDRRFAGVWIENTEGVAWSWWLTADAPSYQRYFDALVAGGLRPSTLSAAPDGAILSVFRDDQIGGWEARHNLTAAQYQAEFDAQLARGLRPILVSAGGTGDAARYASVFAADDEPARRYWNASGNTFAGAGELDDVLANFMVKHSIRAGTVAIGRAGVVVGARGYTWAEASYPRTAPETRFRIASLSKMFAAAEASRLVDSGRLAWNTPAFGFIGVNSALPAGTGFDPALAGITVEQLVLRSSHLVRDFDAPRVVASTLGVSAAPIPRADLMRYLYGLPLLGAIPAGGAYSNTAFYLLTSVVEQGSGLSFIDAVNHDVLAPLGISDVAVAATAAGRRQAGEVASYDSAGANLSQLNYAPDALAPAAYGGLFVLENGAGAGGLISSTPSLVRFLAHYPVWNGDRGHLSGRELGTRYGTLEGTASGAVSRDDGLDFAFVFNRWVSDAEKDAIRDEINNVLNRYRASL